jgi:DNA polymerase-3 subunit epsilon
VFQFLRIAAEEHGAGLMENAARLLTKLPSLPAHLDRAMIDAIPEAAGVYLFYGEVPNPLYIGKSVAMRSRVLQHFSDDVRSSREQQIAREIRRIEWRRTCGELGALLHESELVKELEPVFNRQLKRNTELCGFTFNSERLNLLKNEDITADVLPGLYGAFRSRRSALEALREIANAHRLCLRTLGFEKAGKGACFRHQINLCAGVCAGKESVHLHHARAAAALAGLKIAAWPFRGPIGVIEEDAEREATDVHLVDQWCWLGTARTQPEIEPLLQGRAKARFDLDHYKILARFLGKRGARVIELGEAVH